MIVRLADCLSTFTELEYIKHNYQLLIIKLLILGLFGWVLYSGLISIYNRWYIEIVTSEFKTLMRDSQFLNMIKRISIGIFLILIPTIGVFINRQIGWFLITSFSYFIISFITFSVMDSNWTDIKNPEMGIVYIIVSVFPIIIMNKEKVRNDIYSIPKTDILTKNIMVSIIGMGITIIITYLNQ